MSLRGLPPKTTDRIAGRTAPAGLRRMPCLTGPPRYRSSRLGTLGTAARCACFGGQTLAKSQVMAQVRKRRRQRVARSGHAGKNACGSCRRHGVRAAAVSASSQKTARCLASRPGFFKTSVKRSSMDNHRSLLIRFLSVHESARNAEAELESSSTGLS